MSRRKTSGTVLTQQQTNKLLRTINLRPQERPVRIPNDSIANSLINMGLPSPQKKKQVLDDIRAAVMRSQPNAPAISAAIRQLYNEKYPQADPDAFAGVYNHMVRQVNEAALAHATGLVIPNAYLQAMRGPLLEPSIAVSPTLSRMLTRQRQKISGYFGRLDQSKQKLATPSDFQLQHFTSFPQWIGSTLKKQQQTVQSKGNMLSLGNRLKSQNDPQFTALGVLDRNLALWDRTQGRWVGKQVSKQQLGASSFVKNYEQRIKKSQGLLSNQLNQQQVLQQIPPFIKDLVKSNQALSKVGFGPISKDGVPLYAGRWIDNVTGRIRVLPTANKKYINPTSKNQMLGYLQAKMINHWNVLITDYLAYQKLSKVQSSVFKDRSIKRINNSLNIQLDKQNSNKKISNTIVQYRKDPNNALLKNRILRNITSINLNNVYNMPANVDSDPQNLTPQQITQLNDRFDRWSVLLDAAAEATINQLTNVTPEAQLQGYQYLSLVGKIRRLSLNLKFSFSKSYINGVLNLAKIQLVPDDITYPQMLTAAQSVDQIKTKLDRQWGNKAILSLGNPANIDFLRQIFSGAPQLMDAANPADIATLRKGYLALLDNGDNEPLAPLPKRKRLQYMFDRNQMAAQ